MYKSLEESRRPLTGRGRCCCALLFVTEFVEHLGHAVSSQNMPSYLHVLEPHSVTGWPDGLRQV